MRMGMGAAAMLLGGGAVQSAKVKAQKGFGLIQLQAPDLGAMREFYGSTLGLPTHWVDMRLLVNAGSTELFFEHGGGAPKYHFAFNIPENQIESALEWTKKRTPVVNQGREIFHFSHWNAHAIYFFDPAGNIVEFIARHTLPNAQRGGFNEKKVLHASELGVVVPDVTSAVKRIETKLGLKPYHGTSPEFAAMGDEHALLIVVKKGRLWFGTKDMPATAHSALAQIEGKGRAELSLSSYSIRVQ